MKNLIKKLFVIISLVSIISISLTTLITPQTLAIETGARDKCDSSFLGLDAWDCGIDPNINNEEGLKKNAWMIAVNIAKDITVIAAYLVIGYVIYGGYQYTFSSGDPNKVATGKKTLTQAFIGLAIVMSANVIMTTIRYALGTSLNCVRANDSGSIVASGICTDASKPLINSIHWFIGVAGVVSAIFIVYGGISYITSGGDPNKLQKAKHTITYALIGLAIVALAEVITAFVSNMIREANKNATLPIKTNDSIAIVKTKNNPNLIKNISISKEDYEK